jgi:ubiquitin C-terminal hydrolase
LLNYFTSNLHWLAKETEKLNENNAYACSNCGSLQSAEKTIYATQDSINKAPEFIILNINCFSVDSELVESLHYEKTVELKIFNNQSSSIGQTHEINGDEAKDLKYDLAAMVIHVGATKTSGHY